MKAKLNMKCLKQKHRNVPLPSIPSFLKIQCMCVGVREWEKVRGTERENINMPNLISALCASTQITHHWEHLTWLQQKREAGVYHSLPQMQALVQGWVLGWDKEFYLWQNQKEKITKFLIKLDLFNFKGAILHST